MIPMIYALGAWLLALIVAAMTLAYVYSPWFAAPLAAFVATVIVCAVNGREQADG
jgi:membrane protein YdbS with pleckstrin-like domain